MFGINLDYYQDFGVQKLVFAINGLNIPENTNEKIITNKGKLALNITGCILTMVAMIRLIYQDFSNMDGVTEILTVFSPAILTFIKFCIFFFKIRKLSKVKQRLQNLLDEVSFDSTALQFCKYYTKQDQLFVGSYNRLCVFTVTLVFLKPFIISMISTNGPSGMETVIPGLYFNNMENPLKYIFVLILNCLFAVFVTKLLVGIDGTFVWFIFKISTHFRVMRHNLDVLTTNPKPFTRNGIKTESLDMEMAKLFFYHHQNIMKLINEFDGIFCQITFIGISFCSVQFCFYIYRMSCEMDVFARIYIFTALAVLFTQIFGYCFGGEHLQSESDEICEAIYRMVPWENLPTSTKRSFLMALMRAQRSPQLTGYFFVLNRVLLVKILKSAFSFAAVLEARK